MPDYNEACEIEKRCDINTIYEQNGAQIVVASLLSHGVDTTFGFPGGTVIPLYDQLRAHRDQLRHVLVRHEQGAVHAACAYARVTGRPGVAIATSGPGASNLITGMMDAYMDSTPMVVIAGQVNTDLIGYDAFQECDMMSMTNPVTKHNFQVRDVNRLASVMNEAFYIACTGRPGPVYIDLPKDVQLQPADPSLSGDMVLPFYEHARPVVSHAVQRAAVLIRNAARPLMIIGQGAVHAQAWEPLGALARALKIPVATTILAKGAFDERDPLSVGCVGMHGRRVANYAVANCDVMIAVGCRFSDRITGETKSFAHGKKIIHVDIDPCELGKNVPAHVALNCDALDAARALSQELNGTLGDWEDWTRRVTHYRRVCNRCVEEKKTTALLPRQVMDALGHVIAEEDIVTTGVGQHQMFAAHYLYRSRPRTFITSGGAGTMGFGLPAAIGAALGRPDATVWALDGDGSLQMTVQELGTLAACGAKVNVIAIDNGYLGMVRQWQELYVERRYSAVELTGNPDFVKLAQAYGIKAVRATDPAGLKAALAMAKDTDESVLVHVAVEKESNIMPMIPPGGKLTEFYGHCIDVPGQFFSANEGLADTPPGDQK